MTEAYSLAACAPNGQRFTTSCVDDDPPAVCAVLEPAPGNSWRVVAWCVCEDHAIVLTRLRPHRIVAPAAPIVLHDELAGRGVKKPFVITGPQRSGLLDQRRHRLQALGLAEQRLADARAQGDEDHTAKAEARVEKVRADLEQLTRVLTERKRTTP